MSCLAIAASVLLTAMNDPIANDEVGHGPVIELDVFGLQSGLTTSSRFSLLGLVGGTTGNTGASIAALAIPAVRVGWEADQNDFLIGLQLLFIGGGNGQSAPIEVSIPFTYRRYFRPLVTGGFSPFAEGSFDLDLFSSGGTNSQTEIGFGVEAGFGGEWLFAKNFGLFAKAVLGFQNVPSNFLTNRPSNTSSTVTFGIGGVLGVLAHF